MIRMHSDCHICYCTAASHLCLVVATQHCVFDQHKRHISNTSFFYIYFPFSFFMMSYSESFMTRFESFFTPFVIRVKNNTYCRSGNWAGPYIKAAVRLLASSSAPAVRRSYCYEGLTSTCVTLFLFPRRRGEALNILSLYFLTIRLSSQHHAWRWQTGAQTDTGGVS